MTFKGLFTDERALFRTDAAEVTDAVFEEGESPLKHCSDIIASNTIFRGKYPLWYSRNITVRGCTFGDGARAGMWYTNHLSLTDTLCCAQKCLRRCSSVTLENVTFTDAPETLWDCSGIAMKNVSVNGDYLAMNCRDMDIDRLTLNGKYSFDGAKNVTVRNSTIIGRDAFWNCEDITAENCYFSGAYLGWNSKRLTFKNCTIESLQGMCYIEDLVLINCKLVNTTLAFEYSSVNADISGSIDSVINPSCGVIKADSIGELTIDKELIDVNKISVILNK